MAFLKQIIRTYQNMSMDVDVTVLSEAAKDLGPGVEVVVGLPCKNPWSLAFAHKQVFVDNVNDYDLFVYSEDDMEVSERNIQAFVGLIPELDSRDVPGYLRYEMSPSGEMSFPEMHGAFHWKPESVRRRGNHTIAEFTNLHAGFYVLTQKHLRMALLSKNYLKRPYEGRYGLPETAATDPYTCGDLRKVICVSTIDDFLIHHLPNRYVARLGIGFPALKSQLEVIMDVRDGSHPVSTLCETDSKMSHGAWSKCYDERTSHILVKTIPTNAMTVLSIGCGWGATEMTLKRRGLSITVLPLDSIIGGVLERQGLEVIYGSLEECLSKLQGRTFGCILISHLLQLREVPACLVQQCVPLVEPGGILLLAGPNFDRLPTLIRRVIGRGDYRGLRRFNQGGINAFSATSIASWLRSAGLEPKAPVWLNLDPRKSALDPDWRHKFVRKVHSILLACGGGRFIADTWIVSGRKNEDCRTSSPAWRDDILTVGSNKQTDPTKTENRSSAIP